MRRLHADAEHWMHTRVRHPDGGERTVAETQADEVEQREQISRVTARDPVSTAACRVAELDSQVCSGLRFCPAALLLRRDHKRGLAEPVSMSLAFAITLAAMVTVLAYGFLSFTGHRCAPTRTMQERCTSTSWTG